MTSKSTYKYICKDTLNSRTFNPYQKRKNSFVSLPKIPEKFIASKNDDENIIDINNEGGD